MSSSRLLLPLLLLGACATTRAPAKRRLEMDPLTLQAGHDGKVEVYDAATLFDAARKALEARQPAEAQRHLERLLREYPGSSVEKPARYNLGLARELQGDCAQARAHYAAA